MLNHSRRAPPPAPLIRLFNPNGEERRTRVDKSSADSSPVNSSSESNASSEFDSIGSFGEHLVNEDCESSESSKPYIQMRMEWLKSSTLNKHDSLPTSVSSLSSRSDYFMIPTPTSAKSNSLQDQQRKGLDTLITSTQNYKETQQDKTKPVIDWLGQLADSSYNTDGEVLLFFQSDQEPGKRVRFEC